MDREFTILLVEDDPVVCAEFVHCVEGVQDVTLVGVTNNAGKALELIQDLVPDAVILDLELHLGSGSGLTVLQGLKELQLAVSPYVLIATNNSSSVTYSYARQLGADFIMSKQQQDYSSKTVIDFLNMMRTVIQGRTHACAVQATSETPVQLQRRIRQRISAELNLVGIRPNMLGYRYLSDAIEIVLEKPTQNLRGIVAAKYKKTDASVERAMQNAIHKAWRTADIEDLLAHYTAKISSDKGVPTLTEFVYYYADKIAKNY